MSKEKKLWIYKRVHQLTILIGILTIVLPLVFWSKIPQVIPTHYGASGMADNYSDKGVLILLFFVIAILMGVMNIAVYFVKISATSKHATEAEKSQMDIVYPMIIFMNLAVQVIFAYMMLCCVTSRNLGVLFVPISLIAVFAPVVYFLYLNGKNEAKSIMTLDKYKQIEKQEEGIVYRSKVDWWLGLLLGGTVACMLFLAIEPIVKGRGTEWFIMISAIFVLLIVLPLFSIKYVLYSKHLFISCGIYGKIRVPYEAICNVKETKNPLSSAALSIDRLQIDYTENGRHQLVLISPVRKKEFIGKLKEYRNVE